MRSSLNRQFEIIIYDDVRFGRSAVRETECPRMIKRSLDNPSIPLEPIPNSIINIHTTDLTLFSSKPRNFLSQCAEGIKSCGVDH